MMQNFVIVGTQRTGSTALFRALNFHPDIACGGEWTMDVMAHRKFAVTERALSGDFSVLSPRLRKRIDEVFSPDKRWLGFKLLFRSSGKWLFHPRYAPALWLDRFEAYIRWLADRPGIHVIHIVRSDPIEWLKSKYVSDRAKAWAGRSYPENIVVEVPIAAALRRLTTKDWIDRRLSAIAGTNPYEKVRYEDFLSSDRAIVLRLMKLLGCDPTKLGNFDYRMQKRQSQRPTSDYITNYDQLVTALRQRGFLGASQG